MAKRILLFNILICFVVISRAGIFLDVRVFVNNNIKSVTVTPQIGKYTLMDNDKVVTDVLRGDEIRLSVLDDNVLVMRGKDTIGIFAKVSLSGSSLINTLGLKPANVNLNERVYDDDIVISVVRDYLMIVNHVDLEHYVAGVVQSEGGGSAKDNDFYEVQAICCRTYALNNSYKHAKDGYNLCDDIHCQLYSGRCTNSDIFAAVVQTAGDVIVDKEGKMISAAFHSNSGGQTANSEDVWTIPVSYLKSIDDTFSVSMPNATWEKKMLASDWLNYLSAAFNYPVMDSVKKYEALNFRQDKRKKYFCDSIKLTTIRSDLGLRSTFFSIEQKGQEVVIKGRGYGHGVGLSQQGAIRMAELGYTYKEIIDFYYKDVDIISSELLLNRNF